MPLPSSTDLVNVTGQARSQTLSPLLEVRSFLEVPAEIWCGSFH